MTAANPTLMVDEFLAHALAGDTRLAVGIAMGLVDEGFSADTIIAELLAPAQHQIGERWQRNELSIADEHLATGITDSAVHAVANAYEETGTTGLVVVACAEGDWHAMAARMFSEQLRYRQVVTAFLGASTPSSHLGKFIDRHRPEALAISCSLPFSFAGVTSLTDVAHSRGVPVIAGGRALHGAPARALALGADAWCNDVDVAVVQLDAWRADPPHVRRECTPLPSDAIELDGRAHEVAATALDTLAIRFPSMASYDTRQISRTREGLADIVRYVAAAVLVDDPEVLTDYLDWLDVALSTRGFPPTAIATGLVMLAPPTTEICPSSASVAHLGLAHLTAASRP